MKRNTLLSFLFLLCTAAQCFQFESINLLSEVTINQLNSSSVEALSRVVDKKGNVTQHGHVWSQSPNPVLGINSQTTNLGVKTDIGEFKSTVRGLQNNATYFIRAFVIIDNQVVYGKESSFEAGGVTIKPGEYLNLLGISDIKSTTATAEAKIEKLGSNSQVIKYGHCWATTENPTINNSKVEFTNNIGLANFSSNLTGLSPNTTYYVRAYMITSQSNGQAIYSVGVGEKIKTPGN
jgi:hypothetical protein